MIKSLSWVLRQFASRQFASRQLNSSETPRESQVRFREEENALDLNSFWAWSGRYVGYRSSDCLFDPDGRQVGFFAEGDEVYASDGAYIGEVRGSNRLITNLSKKKWTRASFIPRILKTSPGHSDVSPKAMLSGFEDFSLGPGTGLSE